MKSPYKEHNTKEKKSYDTKTRNESQPTINSTQARPTKKK